MADSTAAIQAALDAAGRAGGGVVFLPAGTYRVAPRNGATAALFLRDRGVVLRGAGTDRTLLFNTSSDMRGKAVLRVAPRKDVSWNADGVATPGIALAADLPGPGSTVQLDDVSGFVAGDLVVLRNDLTASFIERLGMTGKWRPGQSRNRTLAYCRRILSVDTEVRSITLDIPARGFLFRADGARVVRMTGEMLAEVGVEDLAIGMAVAPGEGLAEEDHARPGTTGHAAHGSAALHLEHVENGWVRRVASRAPPGNPANIHLLSNGLRLVRTRLVTVTDCDFRHPQYRGGGGNGYLYTLNGQDCLVRDSQAEGGRHNFDFGTMAASGNVLLDCLTRDGVLASDFHMFLSLANLLDNVTCDGDFLEARALRPWGEPMHGVTTTQSVFWNTNGLRYPPKRRVVVYSHQFGDGYVIGTRGPASAVDSSDHVEGVGRGDTLQPRSLYLDQLARRGRAAN